MCGHVVGGHAAIDVDVLTNAFSHMISNILTPHTNYWVLFSIKSCTSNNMQPLQQLKAQIGYLMQIHLQTN